MAIFFDGLDTGTPSTNPLGLHSYTLFGQSVHENPVPTHTAEPGAKPFLKLRDPRTGKSIGISKAMLSYGVALFADPGGGKTNLMDFLVDGLLKDPDEGDVRIIFDPKGDYLQEFGSRIPEEEKIVIGVGEEYRKITSTHSLFAEVMPRGADGRLVYVPDTDTDTLDLAKQLFQNMGSETQPVFPAMARQIFAGCMLYFIRSYWLKSPEKLNNRELIDFLTGSSLEELRAIFELDYMKDFRICGSYISGKAGPQSQGVTAYLGTVIRDLFVGPFAQKASERSFSMREAVLGGSSKTVFIEYDLKRGEALAPIYGVLIDRALANALGGRRNHRSNVYIILDEVLQLPKINHLSQALTYGRSQNVKCLCGLQNYPGLVENYGEAGAKSVLASFQSIFAFHLSDYDTRQFLCSRLGTNYRHHSFGPQQENLHAQREGYTVEDWDLMNLKLGEAVIQLKGERPFLFTMPRYK